MLWIILGIVAVLVLAVAVWAYWPRAGGVSDHQWQRNKAHARDRGTREGRPTANNFL